MTTDPALSRALGLIFATLLHDPKTSFQLRNALTRSTKRVSEENRQLILELSKTLPSKERAVIRRAYA